MIRQFVRDSVIYMIPTIVSRGIAFFLVPLYTRILNPADYGVLDLFMMLGNLVNLTVAMEISQGLAIYHAETKDEKSRRQYASTALWFTLLCYGAFLVISLAAAEPLAQMITGHPGNESYLQIALIYIFFNGLFLFLQNQLRWELRSKQFASSSIVMTIITAFGAFFFSYIYDFGLSGILYGMILGAVSGCLLSALQLSRTFMMSWDSGKLKEMLSYSLPLVPSSICVFLSLYIDRALINAMMTLEDVGIYGIGVRVATITTLLIAGVRSSITPLILQHHQKEETPSHIMSIFKVFIAFSLFFFLGSALFIKEFLWLMTTPAYYEADTVVPFLVLATLLANMYMFTPGIFLVKKTGTVVWINLSTVVINVALNLALIPLIGILGAAISTLMSSLASFFVYFYFNQKIYPLPFDIKPVLLGSIGILLLSIPGFIIHDFSAGGFAAKILLLIAGVFVLHGSGLVNLKQVALLAHKRL